MNKFEFRLSEFKDRIRQWGGGADLRKTTESDIHPLIQIHFRVGTDVALEPLILDGNHVTPSVLADTIAHRALYEMKAAVDKKLVALEQERFNRIHGTASLYPTEQDTPKAPEAGR